MYVAQAIFQPHPLSLSNFSDRLAMTKFLSNIRQISALAGSSLFLTALFALSIGSASAQQTTPRSLTEAELELKVAELLDRAQPVALPTEEAGLTRAKHKGHLVAYRVERGVLVDSIVMTPERMEAINAAQKAKSSTPALNPADAQPEAGLPSTNGTPGKTNDFAYPTLAHLNGAYPNYPLSVNCKLLINLSGGTGACSGAIIGHHEIMTAGHCLKASGNQIVQDADGFYGYAIPSFNDPQGSNVTNDPSPFGIIGITGYLYFDGWWNDADYNFDVAFLTTETTTPSLSNRVGGHLILQANNIGDLLSATFVNTFGWPVNDFQGNLFDPVGQGDRMYAMGGDYDQISQNNNNCICATSQVWQGQSGSNAYLFYQNVGRFAVAVISHGRVDNSLQCHTVVNQAMYNALIANSSLGTEDVAVAGQSPFEIWAAQQPGQLLVTASEPAERIELVALSGQVVSTNASPSLVTSLATPSAAGIYLLRATAKSGAIATRKVNIW